MNKKFWIATSVSIALSAAALYTGLKNKANVEDIVKKEIDKRSALGKLQLEFNGETYQNIPETFSKCNTFVPDTAKPSNYWESKDGFAVYVDCTKKDEWGFQVGSKIDYKVTKNYSLENNADEKIIIFNYNNSIFPISSVHLTDKNHDGLLDYIYLNDEKNNTSITIRRNTDGELTCEGVLQEDAKKVYDSMCLTFNEFKNKYDIQAQLDKYSKKVEINITTNY